MALAPLMAGYRAAQPGSFSTSPPGPFTPSGRSPVVFGPDTPLLVNVYVALGADLAADPSTWLWTDISRYARWTGPGSAFWVSTGRGDESARVRPGEAAVVLDNRDGRFSRLNPMGAYFGQLTRNTPILVTINAGNGAYNAVEQFVNEWPARWDSTATDFTMPIKCAGMLRRLDHPKAGRLRSAMYRAITATSGAPVAYWPLEDGRLVANPTAFVGRALVAAPAALFSHAGTGSVSGSVDGPAGSDRAVDMSGGGQLTGYVSGTSGTSWRVGFAFQFRRPVQATESGDVITINTVDSAGNPGWWRFGQANASVWGLEYGILGDSEVADDGFAQPVSVVDDGAWHWLEIAAEDGSGTNANVKMFLDGFKVVDDVNRGFIKAGSVRSVVAAQSGDLDGAAHLAVWPTNAALSKNVYAAFRGHAGENAAQRVTRLCAEEGVRLVVSGPTWNMGQTMLGPQGVDKLLTLLRDAEDADGGVLYEVGHGLGFQPLAARYNAPVAMVLDHANGELGETPKPTDDTQRLVNSWTIGRRDGAVPVTVTNAASVATEGLHEDGATLNLFTDDQAQQVAAFRVGAETIDDYRWPSLTIRLDNIAGRQLVEQWTALPFGTRIQVRNIPNQVTSDPAELVIEGKRERFSPLTWVTELACSPYRPYEVHQVEADGNRGRVDSDNTTLHAAIDATTTSVVVEVPTAAGPFWRAGTPPGGSADILVTIGNTEAGERMTVTNVSAPAGTTQTLTVVRSVNGVVKAHNISAPVRLWRPGRYAL